MNSKVLISSCYQALRAALLEEGVLERIKSEDLELAVVGKGTPLSFISKQELDDLVKDQDKIADVLANEVS
jgi:hypothetical protein